MKNLEKYQSKIKNRSLPFWSWNGRLEKEELEKQIEWMKEKRFGGFFMHARGGLTTEYLSEEWFSAIKTCTQKAEEVNMDAWAYDENGWPSGFVGMKLLEKQENLENYLLYTIGAFDESADYHYDISSNVLRKTTECIDGKEYLNIFIKTSISTVDVTDDAVVEQFIQDTHERYKEEFGEDFSEKLKGFFTDEPQYFRGATPFPHKIKQYFADEYNEDVTERLGLLFVEKEGYQDFRYKFWKACQSLFLKNYSEKVYNWCDNNGVQLTGHYVEEANMGSQMIFNAGIMPYYEFEHIPGMDWLCRRFMSVLPARQLGSVCVQLGKKDVLTETFALTGWDVTPRELKAIAEYQCMYGPNIICQHLLPYSESGERKHDYPAHFSWVNPWVDEAFDKFNEYFDRLGTLFAESSEKVNVGVLHPMRTAYFYYKKTGSAEMGEIDKEFVSFCNDLAKKGVGYHLLDETLLAKYGFVEGTKIGLKHCTYEYLIIPSVMETMDKTTEKLLREYVQNGGKILVLSNKLAYLEGKKYEYPYLKSNIAMEEIASTSPYSIKTDSETVFSVYKTSEYGDYIFVLNADFYRTANVRLDVQNKQLSRFLIEEMREEPFENEFILQPNESAVLFVTDKKEETIKQSSTVVDISAQTFTVKEISDNYMVLDFAEYSLDGETWSARYPLIGIFQELLKQRYAGKLWVRFSFEVQEKPDDIRLLYDNCNPAKLFVNGNEVFFDKRSKLDKNILEGDIVPYIQIGTNVVIQELNFYQKDIVYTALFDEKATEGLRNCLVYDTYMEDLRLAGDFGVYSKSGFVAGKAKNVLLGEDFYIGRRKNEINSWITDGYPFFAGNAVMETVLNLSHTNIRLKLGERTHYCKVRVNGVRVQEALFNNFVDIGSYACVGENVIQIELYTGNRNLFGPFHLKGSEEPLNVSPSSFEMFGSWNNFENPNFRNAYAFVKTDLVGEE